ncbi:hypothetical protein C7T94_15920 [Pedobacter yulinensis]|uniref:Uncharacterized protein n=1 Tax=Pedobacter yulinensis TaxID=2126353 RepID=A0A2T3HIL4_9SPHI|nr:hypothetical protein [Pedobacter yulinensis]PST82278.1 hypothetical protein C7T94_15920 [Pedobacter yulinensis]
MLEEIEDREWMETAKELMKTGNATPFEVPAGYFEALSAQLNACLKIDEASGTGAGFNVPPAYFDHLQQQISARVLIRETQAPAQQAFSTPPGYFETLSPRIFAATRPSAPVRRLWPLVAKYAAAASVVLLAGLAMFYSQEPPVKHSEKAPMVHTTTPLADQYLYDIDEQVIVEHVQMSEAEALHATPSQDEVESYILNHYSQNELISAL